MGEPTRRNVFPHWVRIRRRRDVRVSWCGVVAHAGDASMIGMLSVGPAAGLLAVALSQDFRKFAKKSKAGRGSRKIFENGRRCRKEIRDFCNFVVIWGGFW